MSCLDGGDGSLGLYDWFQILVGVVLTGCVIGANTFIIFSVVRNWRRGVRASQKMSTLLLLNLSTADVIIGISFVYFALPRYLCPLLEELNQNIVPCILRFSTEMLGLYGSGFTMIAICIDRYLAVIYALQYGQLLTVRRTCIMIGVIWVSSFACSLVLFFWNNWEMNKDCTIKNVIPLIYNITMGMMVQIMITIIMVIVGWRTHMVVLKLRNKKHGLSRLDQLKTKSARSIWLFLVTYLCSWAPFHVTCYIQYADVSVSPMVIDLVTTLTCVNYVVNPFIYAYNVDHMRSSMSRAVKSFRKRMPLQHGNKVSPSNIYVGRIDDVRTIESTV